MHQLEHDALDDPFLMDALEGYEMSGKDEQGNLNELMERLQKRTTEKRGRVISWKVWSIAASVLVVLTIGGLWLKNSSTTTEKERVADVVQTPQVNKTQVVPPKDTVIAPVPPATHPDALIAQNVKPAPVVKDAIKQPVAKPSDNAVYQQEISATDNKQAAAAPSVTDHSFDKAKQLAPPVVLRGVKTEVSKPDNTQQLSEAVVMGYTSQSKKDSVDNAIAMRREKTARYSASSILPGKVDGLTVIPADPKSQAEASRITGIIISKGDGSPVIGAAIRIKGTNKSTVTDTNGKFALPASPANNKNETLDIASIGFERKQVSAKVGDSLKVELKDASNSLNEVVVTGYGSKKDDDLTEPAVQNAHPQNNWSGFKKYLQNNAVLPDGTIGNVNVSFTVEADGSLNDFKIKKSLNAIADQKAIDLIKNDPAWVANNNHKPEIVTVKVKFQKQK